MVSRRRSPAVGELAGVLVRPFRPDVVRSVCGPRGEIDEERLVRHEGLLLTDPANGLVGEVLSEVIPLLGGLGRLDRCSPLVEGRVVLVVLAADEPIEVLETSTP